MVAMVLWIILAGLVVSSNAADAYTQLGKGECMDANNMSVPPSTGIVGPVHVTWKCM